MHINGCYPKPTESVLSFKGHSDRILFLFFLEVMWGITAAAASKVMDIPATLNYSTLFLGNYCQRFSVPVVIFKSTELFHHTPIVCLAAQCLIDVLTDQAHKVAKATSQKCAICSCSTELQWVHRVRPDEKIKF